MVLRCFTEKRAGNDVEARSLENEIRETLGISSLTGLRLFNRYDVEGIDSDVYARARISVFSEPQVDDVYDEALPEMGDCTVLAVEALPGQYDQRADSCAQCIQILTCLDRPAVASAKVYVFFGALSEEELTKLESYLINPVESRRASLDKPETLAQTFPEPKPVATIDGFISMDEKALSELLDSFGLAMDIDDLLFMQEYFRNDEKRDPTVTELKLVDTYWSDHCRHTTFSTHIDSAEIEDEDVRGAFERYIAAREEVYGERAKARPITLMDAATIGTKTLKKRGFCRNIDESEEINACSIHIDAEVGGEKEDWLLMFKNETHNHPTEIEPFGGAATCIGGAIRDPLSGRAYVYQAMRVTGAGDPRVPLSETISGKLPQRKLTVTAAQGYSSYGNQIGLSTGLVHEFYHPGYVAKRMEIGAVVGAVKAENVVRVCPQPGDRVILLGGRTGRDGIGGATGSSKSHNAKSLVTMASEVQKGNAPEERKIQRLFLDPEVTRMIKRCNDFGAGGVSVAIGELADGLEIDLTKVRKKYEGLDGTELAISESQERMAVVVAAENTEKFIEKATRENLEAYVVAEVTEAPRMVMKMGDVTTANLSREFLSSNGASKHTTVKVGKLAPLTACRFNGTASERMKAMVTDLACCSQRGLGERFDGSIGSSSVLMPYGGKTRIAPAQSMAALIPVVDRETDTCSVMSFGFDPYLSSENPYAAARSAVVTSAAKLVAAGCDPNGVYLTFQEYFEKLRHDPARWGKPFCALLGALDAQLGLGMAAIGGKDSMSGSFNEMDVPPTLVSFAIAPSSAEKVLTPEFKAAGHGVYWFAPEDTLEDTKRMFERVSGAAADGRILSAWAVTTGGIAEAVFKMALGNNIGFAENGTLDLESLFTVYPGGIVAECAEDPGFGIRIGETTADPHLTLGGESFDIAELAAMWEATLEPIFPTRAGKTGGVDKISWEKPSVIVAGEHFAKPRAVITAFPGTNCELDTARAIRRAGGEPDITVIRNLTASLLEDSIDETERAIRNAQMIVLPGGFSGGDEPDGSAKFITAFFRNPRITAAVHELLYRRDGLMLGICNGFQALIKLGLVPFGEIRDMDETCPTLTFNLIGRHQSRYVYTRVASAASPWLSKCSVGDVHAVPISHGEGRFVANDETVARLIANGQVATQYCDADGVPSMDISVNPNGSVMAIEGILSPDGRVLGKMGHTERRGDFVAKNIYGAKHQMIFEGGVEYFK
ncbi:MAG: phosphoribosylformylglycinamidine synthase [Oscillospiraceae bacterium]|nr:phosphoribosylformylglycinamidine synthase [Oscillospiraceae bacterium]